MSVDSRFYTAEQFSIMFGKTPQWATRLAREGRAPVSVVRVGHLWFFNREESDALLNGDRCGRAED